MTGAIEFLQKAKAICKSRHKDCYRAYGNDKCPVYEICCEPLAKCNEGDLVRKVMEYRLEDADESMGKSR